MWRFIFGLIPGWLIRSDRRWLNAAYLWSARRSYSAVEEKGHVALHTERRATP